MPRDRFALAIFIRREEKFVRILEGRFQFFDRRLLRIVDDVVGLERVVNVDRQFRPRLLSIFRRNLRCLRGEVTNVPNRRQDRVVVTEVSGDLLRLRR